MGKIEVSVLRLNPEWTVLFRAILALATLARNAKDATLYYALIIDDY